MNLFDAEMHVQFSNEASPTVFKIVVVAECASDVIEHGPALMKRKYKTIEVLSVSFYNIRLREKVEFIIPSSMR